MVQNMQKLIKKHFSEFVKEEEVDLYGVMNLSKSKFSKKALTSSYKKLALKYHPDKNLHSPEATEKFLVISFVHSLLSNDASRQLYDETGEVDETGDSHASDDCEMWKEYWNNLFPKLTVEKIDAFENMYTHSSDERQDIINAFDRAQGDMNVMIELIPFCDSLKAEEHVVRVMHQVFKTEQVDQKHQTKFEQTTTKKASGTRNKKRLKDQIGEQEASDSLQLLQQQILQKHKRKSNFDDLIGSIESRYGNTKKAKKRSIKKQIQEPTDEEFEAIQNELKNTKRSKKKSSKK